MPRFPDPERMTKGAEMSAVRDAERAILKKTLLKATDDQVAMMMPMVDPFMTAQLTSGIAADQRALNYAGFLAAAVIALITAAGVVFTSNWPPALGWFAGIVAMGLLISMGLALRSARPIEFEYPGYNPGAFAQDIEQQKTMKVMHREYLYYSQLAMEDNADRLDKAGNLMLKAMVGTFISILLGFLLLFGFAMFGGFGPAA